MRLLSLLAFVLAASPPPVARYPGLGKLVDKMSQRFHQQLKQTEDTATSVHLHTQMLDGGKVEQDEERWLGQVVKDGKPRWELVRALKDGKDVTATERAKREARRREEQQAARAEAAAKTAKHAASRSPEDLLLEKSPFNPKQKDRYIFWAVAPLPAPGQPLRIHFKVNPQLDDDQPGLNGDAWVDPVTGTIRQLSFVVDPRPPFVDDIRVKLVAAGPKGATTSIFAEGAGHFLFWHKAGRVRLELGYPQAPKQVPRM